MIQSVSAAHTMPPTRAAYEALLPEIQAVENHRLSIVNIDILRAVTTVRRALPRLWAMRPEIAASLPNFNLEHLDKLEPYALALTHAHSQYRKSLEPNETLPKLAAELDERRETMMAAASLLAGMKLIDGDHLESLKKSPGYRALASNVLMLCSTFADAKANRQDQIPFPLQNVYEAGMLALELLQMVGQRDQAPAIAEEIILLRQKAFTLLVRAYDQTRRAVCYLRHDAGDADDIAPSLYMHRRRPGRTKAKVETRKGSPATGLGSAHMAAPMMPPSVLGNAELFGGI